MFLLQQEHISASRSSSKILIMRRIEPNLESPDFDSVCLGLDSNWRVVFAPRDTRVDDKIFYFYESGFALMARGE
jgi:hypothetical protein